MRGFSSTALKRLATLLQAPVLQPELPAVDETQPVKFEQPDAAAEVRHCVRIELSTGSVP